MNESELGRDHWGLLAYCEDCAVNKGGILDSKKLRGSMDVDRLNDLREAGLVKPCERVNQIELTERGWVVAAALRRYYAAQRFVEPFVPPPATRNDEDASRLIHGVEATLARAPGVYGNGVNEVRDLLALVKEGGAAHVSDVDKAEIRAGIAEIEIALAKPDKGYVQDYLVEMGETSIRYLIAQLERLL